MTSTFDPFTASLEDAEAQPDAYATRGPVDQWAGAQALSARRTFYEANPIDGIALCLIHGLVAPDWLANAYMSRFYLVVNCKVRSWDEAFGTPYPQGKNLAYLRRARASRLRVVNAIWTAVKSNPRRPVDPAFWESIGEVAGEGKTRAEELYREALKAGWIPSIQEIRFAQGVVRLRSRSSGPAKFRKPAGIRRTK